VIKKEFKEGDKVFDLRFGNGEVVNSLTSGKVYAKFKAHAGWFTYHHSGKLSTIHTTAMLHHGHDLIVEVKEPVYEYQVIFKDSNVLYTLSSLRYTSKEDFKYQQKHLEFVELYLPSKRLVEEK
jgi:hypothetical protein